MDNSDTAPLEHRIHELENQNRMLSREVTQLRGWIAIALCLSEQQYVLDLERKDGVIHVRTHTPTLGGNVTWDCKCKSIDEDAGHTANVDNQ